MQAGFYHSPVLTTMVEESLYSVSPFQFNHATFCPIQNPAHRDPRCYKAWFSNNNPAFH